MARRLPRTGREFQQMRSDPRVHGARVLGAVMVCLSFAAGTACTSVVADTSACRNLPYENGEVARAQYLPCAAEIMAALDDLDRQTEAALGGDRQARSEGQSTLGRAIALMQAAGGMKLLERWSDRPLTTLNVSIHNAVTHYQAFYMVRILEEPNPYAEKTREAAKAEFDGARRNYQDAGRVYRAIR